MRGIFFFNKHKDDRADHYRFSVFSLRHVLALFLALIFSLSPRSPGRQVLPQTMRQEIPLSFANAEVKVGDRLFFETRFSEYFFENNQGELNHPPRDGDTVVNEIPLATGGSLRGPFRGLSINCRQCHLGDDLIGKYRFAGRTYCDFSRRSTVPGRSDEAMTTVRNATLMPDIMLARDGPSFFHFDGEFVTIEDLTVDTITGRNFGWLPTEAAIARAHIARVIREDNGSNPRWVVDRHFRGLSYRKVLLGVDPDIPERLRLPENYRLNVESASDDEILSAIGNLIRAYVESLRFGTDHTFRSFGSPYDMFLEKNHLPGEPEIAETPNAYARRLLRRVKGMSNFKWVSDSDAKFQLHDQAFAFGPEELRGLKLFLARSGAMTKHGGNCSACHVPPRFSDFRFHNDGVAQIEYDSIFGEGAFSRLQFPRLGERNSNFDHWLPPSPAHPNASGRCRAVATADHPGYTDIGLWNVYANPDIPKPQEALTKTLCTKMSRPKSCSPEALLPQTIALFKTPTVRDLGQSAPYLHTGSLDTIEAVLKFYTRASTLARKGELLNASPEMRDIRIDASDFKSLAAFLRALNEDYH
jgi:cytochrome c peroxidase